jgi:hypothetical protein
MSSSIFSSENLRAYLQIPRETRLWHAKVLAVLVVVYFAGYQLCAALDTQDKNPFSLWMADAVTPKTEAVFIGTSHVFCGAKPDEFPWESRNMCDAGLDYEMLSRILARQLDRLTNLKAAVIEYDSFPMMQDSVARRQMDNSSFFGWGLTDEDLPEYARNKVPQTWAAALIPPSRLTPVSLVKKLTREITAIAMKRQTLPGFLDSKDVTAPEAGVSYAGWYARTLRPDRIEVNRQSLVDMVRRLRERGIRVALLEFPQLRSYRENVPKSWRTELESTANLIQKQWPGVQVWFMSADPAFETSDFRDPGHLNTAGAIKLSKMIAPKIDAMRRE